ncbi:MAG: endonuclease/exonuclease/phosphatase family protein [Novosphingobium sp.]
MRPVLMRPLRQGPEQPLTIGLSMKKLFLGAALLIKGLPWPKASDRDAAAENIASQLADLRRAGCQPHVVAVQEAFSSAAKNIGQNSGYRYVAWGPRQSDLGAPATRKEDRRFVSDARFLKGETLGKYADSGLAIFSDFPILRVTRVPFPSFACAGYDCLANKGVLAVALDVPGHERPLVVINTHLNSRKAARVSGQRSLFAFKRQVDTLAQVVGGLPRSAGLIVAGDFNVGRALNRSSYLRDHVFAPDHFLVAASEEDDGNGERRLGNPAPASAPTLLRTKSLLVFSPQIDPIGEPRLFGQMGNGRMLSDHIGITRQFLIRRSGEAPVLRDPL